MGLKDMLGDPPATAGVCGVKRAAFGLEPSDVSDLEGLVGDVRWPAQTLQRRLREHGIVVSDEAIKKHRNKVCTCFPVGEKVKSGGTR